MTLTHRGLAAATPRVEVYDTIVVGGGQAGLAAGYHLAKHDADFLILDQASGVGDSWRKRWDSLRLFTPAELSALPGMRFPADPMHVPDKDEVADYLQRYAERFDLPIRGNAKVDALTWNGDFYVLATDRVTYFANNVIVATGPFQRPRVPRIASDLPRSVHQIHSSAYRNPLDLPDGPVLVVGVGNSGAQIAMELARTRRVWLSGRESGYLKRRFLGRDIYRWIWPAFTRFSADTRIGRRLKARSLRTDPLIGITPSELTASGLTRVGRFTEVRDGLPYCGNETIDPGIVIWCTGFDPDYSWIQLPVLDVDGYPRHERGMVANAPGLYFVGLRFQHRKTSSLIGGVGADAEFITDRIRSS